MHVRFSAVLCALVLAASALSCRKLERSEGTLKLERLTGADAIPAEFGQLVGVTSNSARPDIAQLWFQSADGAVVVVYVDYKSGRILDDVLRIPRR